MYNYTVNNEAPSLQQKWLTKQSFPKTIDRRFMCIATPHLIHQKEWVVTKISQVVNLIRDKLVTLVFAINQYIFFIFNPHKSSQEISKEYTQLPSRFISKEMQDICPTATNTDNLKKNKHSDIFPFEENRVRHHSNEAFYYNASYVLENQGIAAQAPLKQSMVYLDTRADFWEMIWNHQCTTMVMLTNLKENECVRCDRYWPNMNREESYGEYTIVTDEIINAYTNPTTNEKIVIRTLTVSKDEEERTVTQFHFKNWMDRKGVDTASLAQLVRLVHDHEQNKKNTAPLLVHCSAGVGRTGTFFTAYYCYKQLLKGARFLSKLVKETATSLRGIKTGRNGMIQNEEQYQLVYATLYTLFRKHP